MSDTTTLGSLALSWALMSIAIVILGVAIVLMVLGAVEEGILVDPRVLGLSAISGLVMAYGGAGIGGLRLSMSPGMMQAALITALSTVGVMQSVQVMAAGHPGYGLGILGALAIGAAVLGVTLQLRYNKRAQRKIVSRPLSKICDAPEGVTVRICGNVQAAPEPVISPIGDRPVLVAHLQLLYSYEDPSGIPNLGISVQHRLLEPFYLDDGTDRLRIEPDAATVLDLVGAPAISSGKLPPGDERIAHWLALSQASAPPVKIHYWEIEERVFDLGITIEARGVITTEHGERVMRPQAKEPIYLSRPDREGLWS